VSTPSIVTIRCGIHACDAVADHVRELGVVVDEVDWTVASPTSTLVVRTDAPERITTSELLRVLGTDIEVEADPSGADDPSGEDDPSGDDDRSSDDDLVDEIGRESFPTSDPPSTWAGPE
jgi:hypothetical protein